MADITTLQQSLINAKKVMGKVDSGNFTKGHQRIQTNSITEGNLPPVQPLPQIPQIDDKARQDLSPKKGLTEEKIKNSKLPGRTKKITSSNLKSIIKESVKELLDETIGLKTESDENFQFRVGDRIFYGKITSSKSVK